MSLTGQQLRFLAERPLCKTDCEAAKRVGVRPPRVSEWKRNPEFRAAYERALQEPVEMARKILEAHLMRAAQVFVEGLDLRHYPWRLKAAVEIADRAGLVKGQAVAMEVSPELAELLGNVEGEDGEGEPNV